MTHQVKLDWKEKMYFEADSPGAMVPIDAAEEFGGEGRGARPKALMLTSLAGCSGIDIASLLKKMRAEVDDFSISVAAELTEEHPKYYHSVKVSYDFYGSDMKKDKIQKAVDLSVDKYCGVMEMFRKFADIEIEVNYHEKG
ncbi:MAG: OsmC family peroxiredoxin [Bacteroidetes bacterium]|nr:MAG: OsmC family peroxiredoxin [Bacteroidota bacterium]